eukprot:scaffold27784_cov66-Phaeocystis_antarctica.AAC.2
MLIVRLSYTRERELVVRRKSEGCCMVELRRAVTQCVSRGCHGRRRRARTRRRPHEDRERRRVGGPL